MGMGQFLNAAPFLFLDGPPPFFDYVAGAALAANKYARQLIGYWLDTR
jgi:hypothetical protein